MGNALFAGRQFGPEGTTSSDLSFSVQDVLENHIYYFQSVHESIEPSMDTFSFYVSDGFSQSESSSVNITIEVTEFMNAMYLFIKHLLITT